jgi:hypothetical protein
VRSWASSRGAERAGEVFTDALTALQVAQHRHDTPTTSYGPWRRPDRRDVAGRGQAVELLAQHVPF